MRGQFFVSLGGQFLTSPDIRIFPNPRSCLRLVRALAVEIHENWLEATRYLNMDHLREHKNGEPEGIGRETRPPCPPLR